MGKSGEVLNKLFAYEKKTTVHVGMAQKFNFHIQFEAYRVN